MVARRAMLSYAGGMARIVLLCCLALAGCMPSTMEELRESGVRDEFTVDAGYQQVYRNILGFVRECAHQGILFSQSHIDAQLYTDIEQGEIRVRHNNMGDVSALLKATISAEDEGSRVTAYAPDIGKHPEFLGAIPAAARGEDPDCP